MKGPGQEGRGLLWEPGRHFGTFRGWTRTLLERMPSWMTKSDSIPVTFILYEAQGGPQTSLVLKSFIYHVGVSNTPSV